MRRPYYYNVFFSLDARMVQLVPTWDLKSHDWKRSCEFKSRSGHLTFRKDLMKIKLEMDRERAILLMRACECIARLGMGQFKELADFIKPFSGWETGEEIERFLKEKLYPELSMNSFNSMSSIKCPEAAQVAWDAYQHIRREISWADKNKDWRTDPRDWNEMMTVNYDEPFKASRLEGNFKTERLDD